MSRSYDSRQHPDGPEIQPTRQKVLRGLKRIGPIRGIIAGDDVEVAREISRLWEWHMRLERAMRRAQKDADAALAGGSTFGCWKSKIVDADDATLKRLYMMDEASGKPQDSSGKKKHATSVVGSLDYAQTGMFEAEPSIKSIGFSPTAQESATDTLDHVVIPTADITFAGQAAFTVEVLFNPDTVPTTRATLISCAGTNGTDGWALGIEPDSDNAGKYRGFARRGTQTISFGAAITAGALGSGPLQVFMYYDGTRLRGGINGAVLGKASANGAALTAGANAYIGREKQAATNYYFDGTVGPIAIFSAAKTGGELGARARCMAVKTDDFAVGTEPNPPSWPYIFFSPSASGTNAEYKHLGKMIPISDYQYWIDRSWKLYARIRSEGIVDLAEMDVWAQGPLGSGQNSSRVLVDAGTTVTWGDFTSSLGSSFVTPWGDTQYAFGTALDAGDSILVGVKGGKLSGAGPAWSVGKTVMELRWVKAGSAGEDEILEDQALPSGSADDVPVWVTGTGWVPKKIKNANVDAAAAIAKSKLAALAIVNADVDAAAAITRSKFATYTRKTIIPFMTANSADTSTFTDGVESIGRWSIVVENDYDSGDLTFKWLFFDTVAGNTVVVRRTVYRFRGGAALLVIDNVVNWDWSPADTNEFERSHTVAAANFQTGDVIRVDISRLGADAGDTNTGVAGIRGGVVEYTARP